MRAYTTVAIQDRFGGLEGEILQAAADSVTMIAEEIMTDSKKNYVPVDTGALRMSGTVKRAKIIGTKIEVRMGYGGPTAIGRNVTYALKVHENPDHVGQGKNKYLTKPLYAAVPYIPSFMATFIRQKLLMARMAR